MKNCTRTNVSFGRWRTNLYGIFACLVTPGVLGHEVHDGIQGHTYFSCQGVASETYRLTREKNALLGLTRVLDTIFWLDLSQLNKAPRSDLSLSLPLSRALFHPCRRKSRFSSLTSEKTKTHHDRTTTRRTRRHASRSNKLRNKQKKKEKKQLLPRGEERQRARHFANWRRKNFVHKRANFFNNFIFASTGRQKREFGKMENYTIDKIHW